MKEVLRSELISEEIEILKSKNKSLIGLKGKIVDETKNLLVVETKKANKLVEKKILKAHVTIKMSYKGKNYVVDGKLLLARPWERIKK